MAKLMTLLAADSGTVMTKTSCVCEGARTQSGGNLECKLDKLSPMPGTQMLKRAAKRLATKQHSLAKVL